MLNIALVGNPNSGKTTLFNSLTGSTAHVGNWPGVTVDKKEGRYKYKKDNLEVNIIDLPGIYSLSPYTSEEVISRNYILDEKPDCIINIVDATNLERNLYLTTQVLEIDIPVVVALNMIDIISKNGDSINEKELAKKLKVPVVKISALKEDNLNELMEEVKKECKKKRKGTSLLINTQLNNLIDQLNNEFEKKGVSNSLFHAIKLIENDEIEVNMHPDLISIVDEYKKNYKDDEFSSDFEAIVADARYQYITSQYATAYKRNKNKEDEKVKYSSSDKIDKVLTNKWVGIPIFLVILLLIFHLTFSSNLFFIGSFGVFESTPVLFEGTPFEGLFYTREGINSIGVILQNLVIGTTDAISDGVRILLDNLSSPSWCTGLIVDGVLGGLFAVLSFLPQILLLFLFFSIIEDSGYMARIAFILDRLFRKFGLSGRAFLPLIMGFGCSVPAMVNTRTLADDNEKIATIRVIPFFSCGAKLPILTAISGAIVSLFGLANADIITYSMYLLGMIVAIISIILMRNTTMRGKIPPFIMELPNYHLPQFKSLMLHLWDKLKHFVKKAFTIILASTIIIWFISHFAWNWSYLEDEMLNSSILASLGQFIQPIFTPLGFGSQLTSFGWVFAVAAITGLIAKENVIATFGTLAASIVVGFVPEEGLEGVDSVVQMINATGITVPALISFIAFNMLTIPCFAAVATAKAELPKNKFATTLLFWIVTSYVVSMMIYLIGSFVWTISIFVVLIAVAIVLIVLYNKKMNKKEMNRE